MEYRIVDLQSEQLRMHWKDSNDSIIGSLSRLVEMYDSSAEELRYAVNGGIYEPGFVPTGLYIEKGDILNPLNLKDGNGNFYLKPNGVFAIYADGSAAVMQSEAVTDVKDFQYATQSGPMLLIDGMHHPAFRKESQSVKIRNGVGILPNGKVLLAKSRGLINFYTFAQFFKEMGCENALYLDGTISRIYNPSSRQTPSLQPFAVMIAITPRN